MAVRFDVKMGERNSHFVSDFVGFCRIEAPGMNAEERKREAERLGSFGTGALV